MSEFNLLQSTDFYLKSLTLITSGGNFDIMGIFDEINIFDNIFLPCMSGNILLSDASGKLSKLKLNGNEIIHIVANKVKDGPEDLNFEKLFRVYKVGDSSNVTGSSKMYTMNFASMEYVDSLKKVINSYFNPALYSEIVEKILTNQSEFGLGVLKTKSVGGMSGINKIDTTSKKFHAIPPSLNPFKTIEWITKRSLNSKNVPDFLFFEHKLGYNFVSLSNLIKQTITKERTINFLPKNLSNDVVSEFLGARDFKILTQSNVASSLRGGIYSGKSIAIDTLTGIVQQVVYKKEQIFDGVEFMNAKPNFTSNDKKIPGSNKQTDLQQSVGARTVAVPTEIFRSDKSLTGSYISENDPTTANITENLNEYIFKRKAIFSNLMQKRIKVVLPGNFSLYSGAMVQINMPKFSLMEANETDSLDKSMTGKYIITATRHIIKPNMHETIIEVATDSTNE